jgi:hypothetical protein
MDVDDDLQCPVCLELYSYPIILPCSHVLCREPCAEHLFDFNFIRCPVCRDNCYVSGGISSLPRVIALENIISRYKDNQLKTWEQGRIMGYEYNSRQTGHCRSSSTSILPILLDFEDFLVFVWVDTLCADQSTFDQKAALLFWKRSLKERKKRKRKIKSKNLNLLSIKVSNRQRRKECQKILLCVNIVILH